MTIKVEVRTPRDPINSVLLEHGGRIRRKSLAECAGRGIGAGSLVGVMHALELVTSDNLNVGFLVIVLVEEGAVACASDSARFHHSADAAIKNVFILSRDLGSKDRRCALASGDL